MNERKSRGVFLGKPIEEMTRDELIEAVVVLGRLYSASLLRNTQHETTQQAQEAAE